MCMQAPRASLCVCMRVAIPRPSSTHHGLCPRGATITTTADPTCSNPHGGRQQQREAPAPAARLLLLLSPLLLTAESHGGCVAAAA